MRKYHMGFFVAFCASMVQVCPLIAQAPEKAEVQTIFETIPIEEMETVETISIEDLLNKEVRVTAHWDEDVSDNTLQISQADAERLLRIATAEAEDQGTQGMLKVMEVVINRVNSPDYPDTIEAVITQPHQFEPVANGTYYTAVPSPEAHYALAQLEANLDPDTEIIAFEAAANSKTLAKYFCFAYTHGSHDFYVQKLKN